MYWSWGYDYNVVFNTSTETRIKQGCYWFSMKALFLIFITAILTFPICAQAQQSVVPAAIRSIDVVELPYYLSDSQVVILDVRKPSETALGTLPRAKEANVLSDTFADQVAALDKNSTIIVYCRSGVRSARACKLMQQMGFSRLINLNGGYLAYQREAN